MGESRSFIPFFLLSRFVPQEVGTLLQVHISRPPGPNGYSRCSTPLVVLFSKTASLNYMSLTSLPSFLPSFTDSSRQNESHHATPLHITPRHTSIRESLHINDSTLTTTTPPPTPRSPPAR